MDKLIAKWIWHPQDDYCLYNQTILARKTFFLDGMLDSAQLRITADTSYRLVINDEWVNDGPCRSWPEHYQYDEINVVPFLQAGENEILVIARFYGAGTFHQVPQEAGLLAQLDLKSDDGTLQTMITDDTWETAEASVWRSDTPEISIQQGPVELYDARLQDELSFEPAEERYLCESGPWADLQPRDVALLTRQPRDFRALEAINVVRSGHLQVVCVPVFRLTNPGSSSANYYPSQAAGVATVIRSKATAKVKLRARNFRVWLNGKPPIDNEIRLKKGENILVAWVRNPVGHAREASLVLESRSPLTFASPMKRHKASWVFLRYPEQVDGDDGEWFLGGAPREFVEEFRQQTATLTEKSKDLRIFRAKLGDWAECLPDAEMNVENAHLAFLHREELPKAIVKVENPTALIYDTPESTVVHPAKRGAVELVYDLGEQRIGYFDFDLVAEPGVQIDIFMVEYLEPVNGAVQHTGNTHNGMRYITRSGSNRFTSLLRRSGRYVFITLRGQTKPIHIRHFQLIQSTYPVNRVGQFACSDSLLNEIWQISERTLKLCMEDTYTDCPLYEQTLWVGDARNEALYGYTAFDAQDIGRRCIQLAGQSLERLEFVGSQVPSAWNILLPAWSFLWVLSVWEYYFYTGDKTFLRKAWPWVKHNLQNAEDRCTDHGLFSGPFWNMFDWTPIDQNRETVVHNSMLLAGAIDAAAKCADVLGDKRAEKGLGSLRTKLAKAIAGTWDPKRKAYADALLDDGALSPSMSMHTSFLALLYDLTTTRNKRDCKNNIIDPPEDMVPVGSPFAVMYLYEALEKEGEKERIIDAIREDYAPMIASGATTVWETFADPSAAPEAFPTRSHCHAWSSAPIHFLQRIIVGICQTEPGGKSYEISPTLCGLDYAGGTVATAKGPLQVGWMRLDDVVTIEADAPTGVTCRFVRNKSLRGLKVRLIGLSAKRSG